MILIQLFILIFALSAPGCRQPEKNNQHSAAEAQTLGGSAEISLPDMSQDDSAPDFTLKDLAGENVSLSDFAGIVVILDFWATWCPPCKMELPHFKSLIDRYEEKGLVVIGVALDKEEAVRSFVEKEKLETIVCLGNESVVKAYGGITGIPTTFIIDRKGNITDKFVGYRSLKDFEKAIAPHL